MSRKPSHELTQDPVLNRILDLLKEKGRTEKDMTRHLGLSSTSFTGWKYRESKTFLKYVGPMSEYLNVSMNYLLYGKDESINEDTLSVSELELLKYYRKMLPNQRNCMLETAKCFVSVLENEEKPLL